MRYFSQVEDVLLCGLSFFFLLFLVLLPVFSYCILPLYISTPIVVACGLKMHLHLFNIVRVHLWLPSKADQMVTLNISKVIMLILNCWYRVHYIFIDVSRIYLLFLNYYIQSVSFPAKELLLLSNRNVSLYIKCWSLGEICVSNCGYYRNGEITAHILTRTQCL